MVKPWAEAGYRCICVDINHEHGMGECAGIRKDKMVEFKRSGGSIIYHWGDVRSWWPDEMPCITFAFPPCTHLSLSGARDFKRKGLRMLIDALELVECARRICEASGGPWMLEQPKSRLSTQWRKPDHVFQQWQYGDNEKKETWLWAGRGFVMPEPTISIQPAQVKESCHRMAPGPDRANKRSATPMGFARAVFDANRKDTH